MRYAPVAAVALLTACTAGLEVPSGTYIQCNSTAECPQDYVCQTSLAQCVPLGFDVTAPELVGPAFIAPFLVTNGSEITIAFDTTKTLGLDPEVLLIFGGSIRRTATLSAKNDEQTAFSYRYVPDGTEPETFASVFIRVTDIVGNQGTSESPLSLRFDFTPPQLVPASVITSLAPAPGSLASTASALTNNGTVSVSFQVSEPLSPTSTVTIDDVPATFENRGALGVTYTFAATPATVAPEGVHTMRLTAFDEAGNRNVVELGTINVDTSPPPQAPVDTSRAVVYTRAPWGLVGQEGTGAAYRVEATGLEPQAQVYVLADDGDGVLASGSVSADGTTAIALPLTDHQFVRLVVVDAAGNALPPASVRDITWVGRITNEPGNPHDARILRQTSRDLIQKNAINLTLAQRGSLVESGNPVAAVFGQSWQQVNNVRLAPSARFGHAAAFDKRRGELLVFGGAQTDAPRATMGAISEQWIYDGASWTQYAPFSSSPTARYGHAMAYDSVRDRVVLFGGANNGTALGDTWEWDGASWTQVSAATTGLDGRVFHAMEYDRDSERIILFGGCTTPACATVRGDTWAWNGSAWTRVATTGPAARFGATITYTQNGSTLYGGCTGNFSDTHLDCGGAGPSYRSDRWRWNGSAWTDITDGTEPLARVFHASTWDEADNHYIYGGVLYRENYDRDLLWTSDGSDFFSSAGHDGQGGQNASLSYDTTRQVQLYFGGITLPDDGNFLSASFSVLDYQNFHEISSGTSNLRPASRQGGGVAFDNFRGGLVFSGGRNLYGASLLSEFWSGQYWQHTFGEVTCGGGVSAYAGNRSRIVTLCGNNTYELPNGGIWGQVCTTTLCRGALTTNRNGYGIAYDGQNGRILAFGGGDPGVLANSTSNTMYAYNGTAWSATACTGTCPAARRCAGFAYDSGRRKVVMYGGLIPNGVDSLMYCDDELDRASGAQNDTWEYDVVAGTWARICTACAPGKRGSPDLVYLTSRGVTALVGEGDQTYWEWDGTTWRGGTIPLVAPPTRYAAQSAYDPYRDRLVVFGGRNPGDSLDDTWELDVSPGQHPALFVNFDWNRSGADRRWVRSVTIDASAGGTGFNNTTQQNGATIEAWDPEAGWMAGAGNTSATPAPLSRTATNQCASQFLLPADGHVYARVSPVFSTGRGIAEQTQVVVDSVAATVNYVHGTNQCN